MIGWIVDQLCQLFKLIGLLLVICGLVYAGGCAFTNWIQPRLVENSLPSGEKAQYEVVIVNTGRAVYTDDYERIGSNVTLHGYYEESGGKYRYHKDDIALDERYFGTIQTKERY